MPTAEPAILVDHLSKRYRIGTRPNSYRTLRDAISGVAKEPFRRLGAIVRGEPAVPPTEMIWALSDVSFEIQPGEVVGIIGRNGSGKTTLLKILSRITEPTRGWAEIRGRIGSLLEVGTGFHPELTGRQNIYLNGAILGMKRAQIQRRFEQIVDFSGIEGFLDTPIKHYSSGMYVRLAFAVAAHLEPDILMVDEVLAVGDAAFQRKCLTRMDEISKEGRTVLFVSHNMGLVQSLCQRVILLNNGTVRYDDTTADAVGAYLRSLEETASESLAERTERSGKGKVRLIRIEVGSAANTALGTLVVGRPARFIFHVTTVLPGMSCSFTIYDQFGQPVTYFDSAVVGNEDRMNPTQGNAFTCEIDQLTLIPGRYRINVAVMINGEMQDHLEGASFFDVDQGMLGGRPVPRSAGYGSMSTLHRWRTPI